MGVCCIDTVSVFDLPPVADPSRMLDVGIVYGLKNLDFMGKELFVSFLESGWSNFMFRTNPGHRFPFESLQENYGFGFCISLAPFYG
jgi:hypothetical protein